MDEPPKTQQNQGGGRKQQPWAHLTSTTEPPDTARTNRPLSAMAAVAFSTTKAPREVDSSTTVGNGRRVHCSNDISWVCFLARYRLQLTVVVGNE